MHEKYLVCSSHKKGDTELTVSPKRIFIKIFTSLVSLRHPLLPAMLFLHLTW